MKRHHRPSSTATLTTITLLLQLLLLLLPPTSSQTWEQSNDPDSLCTSPSGTKLTGYKSTLDCRGYVYCADGYLMGGGAAGDSNAAGVSGGSGVIACWPNQLFNEASGVCTYWQDVDTSKCPLFDGSKMMMPDQTDSNANQQRFFCGVSASNAKRVCEPCPGGSRLECSDVRHNCFAGITGCPTSSSSGGGGGGNSSPSSNLNSGNSVVQSSSRPPPTNRPVNPPPTPRPTVRATPRPTKYPTQFPTRRPVVAVATTSVNNPNNNNNHLATPTSFTTNNSNNNNNNNHPTSTQLTNNEYLHGKLRSSYYCGWSWELAGRTCSHACPSGLNDDCPTGQTCFPDTPCANSQNPPPPPPTPPPTPRPVSVEEQTYYCGYDWDWVVHNCNKATPCPHADANGCPMGMKCIADTPCYAINNKFPTQRPTKFPTKNPTVSYPPVQEDDPSKRFCGYDWGDVTDNCLSAVPCPQGFAEGVCPYQMKCIAETPCTDDEYLDWLRAKQANVGSGNGRFPAFEPSNPPPPVPQGVPARPPVPQEDPTKRFCGFDWTDVTDNCLTAVPCPQGFAEGVCPNQMKCISETPCADEDYLDWLRAQQASIGSGGNGSNNPPPPVPQQVPVSRPQQQQQSKPNPPPSVAVYPSPQNNPSSFDFSPVTTNNDNNNNSDGTRCSSDRSCPTGQFCYKSPGAVAGYCGQCSSNGTGCSTEEVCRTNEGCHADALQGGAVVSSKCYKIRELDRDCEVRLNDVGAKCNVQSMSCEGGSQQNTQQQQQQQGSINNSATVLDKGPPANTSQGTSNTAANAGAAAAVVATMYQNPNGNTFFCGINFAAITASCLTSKPCPGGFSKGFCEDNEGCFSNLACKEIYDAAAIAVAAAPSDFDGAADSSTVESVATLPETDNPTKQPTTEPTPEPTPSPSAKAINNIAINDPVVPEVNNVQQTPTTLSPTEPLTTSSPSKAPIVNTNFCGASWEDHARDCANSLPCPRGDECPVGQNCFAGSPCAQWSEQELVGEQQHVETAVVTSAPVTMLPPTKSPIVGTASPSESPTTLPPSESPIVNTNFCGTSWEDHMQDCTQSRPCPRGDECGVGENCFTGSPCAAILSGGQEEEGGVEEVSKVGNFCGSSWNLLVSTCKFATRCPNGNECADGEFCYRDFLCDPPPTRSPTVTTTTTTTTSTTTTSTTGVLDFLKPANDGAGNSLGNNPLTTSGQTTGGSAQGQQQWGQSGQQQQQQTPQLSSEDACSLCGNSGQLDWSERVSYNGNDISCGEFGWIFLSEKVAEGSDQCLDYRAMYFTQCCYTKPAEDGCDLCDTGIDGTWHDIRENVMVDFGGEGISCGDLSNKARSRFEPEGNQCMEAKNEHFDACCFEKCSLCGDSHLDWEATVYFSGEEVKCHELDSQVFVEEGVASGSSRCEMSQSFYASTCCIQAPQKPCNLCSSKSGDYFSMNSKTKVSYGGEIKTCLEVYHSLYSRREQSDGHCINAQGELFNQCCEATATTVGSNSVSGGVDGGVSGSGQTYAEGTSPGDRGSGQTYSEGTSAGDQQTVATAPSTSALTTAPTKKPTAGFDTWYAGALESVSPSSMVLVSFGSYFFSLAAGLIMIIC